jgi:aminopeptidase N
VNLIRFDYENREDMFDRHSYQKGGSVLHMLRKYVGDEAFFDALKLYLNDNKYQPAEIHDLRLAFEKITGEDLNWFFNQWFLDRGHPTVETSWNYDDANKNLVINLNQVQSLSSNSAFKLPMDVDIYNRGTARRVRISMDSIAQTIILPATEKPDFVNIDAERMVLGFVRQLNTREEAEWLFLNGKLYEDRFSALEKLMEFSSEPGISALLKTAMRDKFWSIRKYALDNLEMFLAEEDPNDFKPLITDLALNDKDARVRATATETLTKFASEPSVRESLSKALNDSSLAVQSSALAGLYQSDPENTVKLIEKMEATATGDLMTSIAAIYAASGTANKYEYMTKAYEKATNPNDKYILIQLVGRYAISQDEAMVAKSVPTITEIARKSKAWYLRFSGIQVLVEYANFYQAQVDELTAEISAMVEKGASVSSVQEKEILKTIVKKKISDIEATLDTIREEETDPNLSRMLNQREP